jgi:ornithine carbamoyltransferase
MDLLRLNDLTSPNLHQLIDRAVEMEREFRAGTLRPTLAGKRIALIVDDGGWRNTTALDLGMRLLMRHAFTCLQRWAAKRQSAISRIISTIGSI